jgi:hypothetical protein
MSGRLSLVVGLSLGLLVGCKERESSMVSDGRLFISPNALDFDRVAIYAARERGLFVSNEGRSRLRIEDVWVDGPEGAYRPVLTMDDRPWVLDTGERRDFKVLFSPRQEGEAPAFLVVRTDNREAPEVRLALAGLGVDARAKVETDRLDFGRIEAQSSKQLLLGLKNGSPMDVRVRARAIGADKDELVAGELTLVPGQSVALPVIFKPVRVGVKKIALSVETCEGCPDQVVTIQAEALDRAVVAEPEAIDFGPVPVDLEEHRVARVHNISTETMVVHGASLATGTDPSFVRAAAPGFTLAPNQVRELDVGFNATHLGEATGALSFQVQSVRNPTTDVPLRGHGGSAELCVSPPNQDFGLKPVGSKNLLIVHVRNCGSIPLQLLDAAYDPTGAHNNQFSLGQTAPFPQTLGVGEATQVRAFYEPTRTGDAKAVLVLKSNAYSGQIVRLPLSGRAEQFPPCQIAVTPTVVDFGNIAPGRGAVLGIKVRNSGGDLCAVKNIRLGSDAGGSFKLPGGTLDGAILNPGDAFSFQVSFTAPPAGGDFAGRVVMEVADPAKPVFEVPLVASSENSCLVPSPHFVDFGAALPICPPAPRTVFFTNQCSATVDLSAVTVGPGTTDGEFIVSPALTDLPRTLASGESYGVGLEYRAQVLGQNYSPLFATVPGLRRPVMVPLLGETSSKSDRTDRYVQQDGTKVDVLFVIDNTASMSEEHPRLAAAIPSFVNAALQKQVNLHVAVTTTGVQPVSNACPGGGMGGEAGRFFPPDGSSLRILTDQTPDLAAKLQQNVEVGTCASVEQGLEVARRALSAPLVDSVDDPRTPLAHDGNLGFLRREAGLAIVFVSDEDDHSPETVDAYLKALQSVKGGNQLQRANIYAVAPTGAACSTAGGSGTRYAEAANRTGGAILDICAPDFTPLLQTVAQKAFSPQDVFPLTETPDTTGITVKINGTDVMSGWHYDAATNAVVFDATPAPGSDIAITYKKACS